MMNQIPLRAIPHIGSVNAGPEALARAGVDPTTHEVRLWHEGDRALDALVASGRVIARFYVRYGDPECFIARRDVAEAEAQ